MTRARSWGAIEKLPKGEDFDIFRLFMKDDGIFPNNSHHPLLLFKSAFHGSPAAGEEAIVEGGWTHPWAWGIFPYHHYHSTAWELLLCVKGEANVQLGGETGPKVVVKRGDVILIPPGFAHKQLSDSGGFTLLGAYPQTGCSGTVDTLRGEPMGQQRDNIDACIAPEKEPLTGISIPALYD